VFSKRSVDIAAALADKVAEFVVREGRTPSRFEHAALEREAARDTRRKKTGHGVTELGTRWRVEATAIGWTAQQLTDAIEAAGHEHASRPAARLTVSEVLEDVSETRSSWCRSDVLRAICDRQRPVSQMSAQRWLAVLERAADRSVEHCVDLDPSGSTTRRESDGRSVWIGPTAPGLTSEAVLVEEAEVVAWAIDAQPDDPAPSNTVGQEGLDVVQADAAGPALGTPWPSRCCGNGPSWRRWLEPAPPRSPRWSPPTARIGTRPGERNASVTPPAAGSRSGTAAWTSTSWGGK
jgi:hypothetical protein